MINVECHTNKNFIKVSYPNKMFLEFVFTGKKGPFDLCISEIKPGDIIFIIYHQNKKYLYLLENKDLFQIYGDELNFYEELEIKSSLYLKNKIIKEYIFEILETINFSDLIHFKNDFEIFEYNLTTYLLCCRNQKKYDKKKIRSLIFKSIKNVRLCETIYTTIETKPFNSWETDEIEFTLNFASLNVQIKDVK
jgi:hypothetical protein